jgi:NADH-quinone oxidoreductase subunit J
VDLNHFIFYGVEGVTLLAALAVVLMRKSIHSILSLIGVFLGTSLIFMGMHASFLGFVLIVVYVGAVAVFFLFAVMMLGEKADHLLPKAWVQRGLGIFLAVSLGGVIIKILSRGSSLVFHFFPYHRGLSVQRLGILLYRDYGLAIELAGVLLLVGIFGSVTLLGRRDSTGVLRQSTRKQMQAASKRIKLFRLRLGKGTKDHDSHG